MKIFFLLLILGVGILGLASWLTGETATAQAARPSAIQDEVSYSNDIQPVVKDFCTTCHAGEDPEGDLVLTSYAEVRRHVEDGELLARINDPKDPMPEDGLMPKPFRRLFQTWADGGYLEKGSRKTSPARTNYEEFTPPTITPIDVTRRGFEFLEHMNGHWVGTMNLMGTDYDWMAFDYRPIAPSHVHGIFEGGTIGNLFTAFFVADFKGTRTIMARNGGLLNGIYRTSYFVLDEIREDRKGATYRFVDAYGGPGIMFMELTFKGDTLAFDAWTSRLGLVEPKRHMAFRGERKRPELAQAAAKAVGFPQNVIDYPFPDPLPTPDWTADYPQTSATYLFEGEGIDALAMGKAAGDPRRIDQVPHLSQLTVSIDRTDLTRDRKLHLYLSQKALTDESGKFITRGRYIRLDLLDTLLSFPELAKTIDEFTFTYLHPGDYFLTVVADMDGDGYPSPGDVTHPVTPVTVAPESHVRVRISHLEVRN